MMKLTLCGQWPMVIDDANFIGIDNKLKSMSSFLRSVALRGDDVAKDVYCYNAVAEILARAGNVESVAEFFAGAGLMTLLIQQQVNPTTHFVSDLDANCVAHLHQAFDGSHGMQVEQLDASELSYSDMCNWDFISLDYNASYGKLVDSKSFHSRLLDKAVNGHTPFVHMSDKSLAYFHTNKIKYAAKMGRRIDNVDDFVGGESEFFYREYGYSLMHVAYYRSAAHLLLRPTRKQEYPMVEQVGDVTGILQLEGADMMKVVVQ